MNIKQSVIDLVLGIFLGAVAIIVLTVILGGDEPQGPPPDVINQCVDRGKWDVWHQAGEITREAAEGSAAG